VHSYDVAADPPSFGVPGYMVADFECPRHELMLFHLMCSRCRDYVEMSVENASFRGYNLKRRRASGPGDSR
jgi:hypothetical protein